MPNHVINRLTIIGTDEQIKEVREFLKGEPFEDGTEQIIDFNKLKPMPEDLMIEATSFGDLGEGFLYGTGRIMFLGKEEVDKRFLNLCYEERQRCIELGKIYHNNLQKYNARTWYDWSKEHWGTKWNAYSQRSENISTIWFNTAWTNVLDLMKTLSVRFPDVKLDYCWADQNPAYNCGYSILKAGADDTTYPGEGSKEAYDLYFKLYPDSKLDYVFENGNYRYKEG